MRTTIVYPGDFLRQREILIIRVDQVAKTQRGVEVLEVDHSGVSVVEFGGSRQIFCLYVAFFGLDKVGI